MSLIVRKAGMQTTLQGKRRRGYRHMGVPACGPADGLSMALANRLVGNAPDAPALEITLSETEFEVQFNGAIALTGGCSQLLLNGVSVPEHSTISVAHGDILQTSALSAGCRAYLAVNGGFGGEEWLGSVSTYLPAELGGQAGRALKTGDEVSIPAPKHATKAETPTTLRPHIGHTWMLRATPGPDFERLKTSSQSGLFEETQIVSQRSSRMGAELDRYILSLDSKLSMDSTAVFPGTVQLPPSGKPFLLMADAQTTGGYPYIAQIIRADRHMLGQLRPGDKIRLRKTSADEAANVLREKTALLQTWLGNAFQLW